MRKSRLVMLAIATLLLLTAVLLWHNREPLSIRLLNSTLTNGQVDELRGLRISRGAVALQRLSLEFDSGARLSVKNAVLKTPWGLIFGRDHNQAELAVEQLALVPAESLNSTDSTLAETQPKGIAIGNDLRLSDLIQIADQRLPYKIEIKKLLWGAAPQQRGRLQLTRDDSYDTYEITLSANDLRVAAVIKQSRGQLLFESQLANKDGENALNFQGALTRLSDSAWRFESSTTADLAKIVSLPVPQQPLQHFSNASGNLALTAMGELPDQLLLVEKYRDLSITLQAESVDLLLPDTLVGDELQLSLATLAPVETTLTSISPLVLKGMTGNADIRIKHGTSSEPILSAQLASETSAGKGTIRASGEIRAEQLTPLLKLPNLQAKTKHLGLTAIHGLVKFRASADTPQHLVTNAQNATQLTNVLVALQSNSEVTAELNETGTPPALLKSVGWNSGTVKVSLPTELVVTSERWPGTLLLQSQELLISAQESKSKLRVNTTAKNLACTLTDGQKCSAEVQAEIQALEVDNAEAQISQLEFSSRLEVKQVQQQTQLALQESLITAREVAQPALNAAQVALEQPSINCTVTPKSLSCKSANASAKLSQVELPQGSVSGTINLSDIQFLQSDNELALSTSIITSELEIQAPGNISLDAQLTGKLELAGPELEGAFELHAGMLTANGNWQYHLDKSAGIAKLNLHPATFTQGTPLSSAISGLPLELVSGTLSGEAEIHWPDLRQSSVLIAMEELAAIYEDIFATGIQGSLTAVNRDDLWLISRASPLRIQALDVGLPLTEISFTPTLGPEQDLVLAQFTAKVLEGSVSSPALTWNLKGEKRRSEVAMQGISLRALEKEMEAENFAATGILDLKVPLITSGEGVTIEQGKVEARVPGGRLRYYGAFSAAMLASNPQLKLLSGALEDYNYRELSGTVEYPPSGDMQMQLKLVGRSDSVAADRDLIINLNLQNNIPSMLKSLQASRDLSEALEKQLQ